MSRDKTAHQRSRPNAGGASRRRLRHFIAPWLQVAVALFVAALLVLGLLRWTATPAPLSSVSLVKQVQVEQTGRVMVFEGIDARIPTTVAPKGLAKGDVVISYLESPSKSQITCSSPSSRILDVTHGSTRLVACLSVIGKAVPAAFKATVTPRNQVTMVTLGFSGVDLRNPVDGIATSPSGTAPQLMINVPSDDVIYGEGSSAHLAAAVPYSGATLDASLNDAFTSQVAAATRVVRIRGFTTPMSWRITPTSGQPVTAAVALRVAPATTPAPSPSATPTSTTPSPTPTPTRTSATARPTPTPTPTSATARPTPTPTPTATSATPSPTPPTTTTPSPAPSSPAPLSSSVAFVQADDTGTINGNTTSIGSGQSNQVFAHDTGIGHSVVLMIQTLTNPGTETDTVTSVSSGMGTFHFVNSYNDGADFEIWVCLDTTGAADTVTVTTPTNAWDAFAVEFNAPATGYVSAGGQVFDPPYLGDQSWTVSPGAAGNVAVVGVDTADAYNTGPAAPWTYYNSGYWSFFNGTSAAWQVAPSSAPLTATWQTVGGESSSQGVVLEY